MFNLLMVNVAIAAVSLLVHLVFNRDKDITSMTFGILCICAINCFGLAVLIWPPILI